jgi:prophage regulatory protein
MDAKIMNLKGVCERTTLSRSVIYQLIKRGNFPAPRKLFSNRVVWRVDEVDAWIDARLNAKAEGE